MNRLLETLRPYLWPTSLSIDCIDFTFIGSHSRHVTFVPSFFSSDVCCGCGLTMATALPGFSAFVEDEATEAAAAAAAVVAVSEVDSLTGRLSDELRFDERKPLPPADPEGSVTRVGLESLPRLALDTPAWAPPPPPAEAGPSILTSPPLLSWAVVPGNNHKSIIAVSFFNGGLWLAFCPRHILSKKQMSIYSEAHSHKCHKTSRIFTRTFISARSLGVIF